MNELQKLTKAAMQYQEIPDECSQCEFYEERSPIMGEGWDCYCTFSELANFLIKATARCTRFKRKIFE